MKQKGSGASARAVENPRQASCTKKSVQVAPGGNETPSFIMEPRKRIFIIDDEKHLLSILKEYFQSQGVETLTYEAPPALLDEISEKRPSAILLDIFLPSTSGIDILKSIRTIAPNLPVIMMTGQADDEIRLEALRCGAYAFLTKPFKSFEEVYLIVNNAADHYTQMLKTIELTAEIKARHEHERLNLLELDFLKKLQLMIGETEDPAFVIKNSFFLLKNFFTFNAFAALMFEGDDINIQIYPNIGGDTQLMACVTNTLLNKAPEPSKAEQQINAMMVGSCDTANPEGRNYHFINADIAARGKTYGYAGLYRSLPFNESEAAVFNRFCSNIGLTLEKIGLFNEIRDLSIHDGLTGIYNHAYIVETLKDEIERSKRYKSPLSVVLIDIDDFKTVNDTFGHLAGDMVLKRLAELLKHSLRTIDIVGRYGGEEFLAILPETDGTNGHTVAERFRDAVEEEAFLYGDDRINITVSGGIGYYTHGMDVNRLIKVADDNLYRAKREGKNKICYERA